MTDARGQDSASALSYRRLASGRKRLPAAPRPPRSAPSARATAMRRPSRGGGLRFRAAMARRLSAILDFKKIRTAPATSRLGPRRACRRAALAERGGSRCHSISEYRAASARLSKIFRWLFDCRDSLQQASASSIDALAFKHCTLAASAGPIPFSSAWPLLRC